MNPRQKQHFAFENIANPRDHILNHHGLAQRQIAGFWRLEASPGFIGIEIIAQQIGAEGGGAMVRQLVGADKFTHWGAEQHHDVSIGVQDHPRFLFFFAPFLGVGVNVPTAPHHHMGVQCPARIKIEKQIFAVGANIRHAMISDFIRPFFNGGLLKTTGKMAHGLVVQRVAQLIGGDAN